jgi:hypothetical protein
MQRQLRHRHQGLRTVVSGKGKIILNLFQGQGWGQDQGRGQVRTETEVCKAFIHDPNVTLRGLSFDNRALVAFAQLQRPKLGGDFWIFSFCRLTAEK